MSRLLSHVEFPAGHRPPPIVRGSEGDLWLEGHNKGPAAISREKEVVETNPSSSRQHDNMINIIHVQPPLHMRSNIDLNLQIDETTSAYHEIGASSNANMVAVVSEGSVGPNLHHSVSYGAEVHAFEDIEVEVADEGEDEVVYEEELDVVSSQPVVPFVGMEFHTPEHAYKLYNNYAKKLGFTVRVGSSRKRTKKSAPRPGRKKATKDNGTEGTSEQPSPRTRAAHAREAAARAAREAQQAAEKAAAAAEREVLDVPPLETIIAQPPASLTTPTRNTSLELAVVNETEVPIAKKMTPRKKQLATKVRKSPTNKKTVGKKKGPAKKGNK